MEQTEPRLGLLECPHFASVEGRKIKFGQTNTMPNLTEIDWSQVPVPDDDGAFDRIAIERAKLAEQALAEAGFGRSPTWRIMKKHRYVQSD